MKKTYTIEYSKYGDTLWDNDYGQEDAKKIIESKDIKETDNLEIIIDDEIEDVIISYVEGFYDVFSKKFGKDFCKENIEIKSIHNRIIIRFSKYLGKL